MESFALSDPHTACHYVRRTIELLVEWVYANDSQLQLTVTSFVEVPYALGLIRQSLERQL